MCVKKFVTTTAITCCLLTQPALAGETVTEPFDGVRLIEFTRTLPRQIHGFILDIDLSAEGIGFFVTPSNGTKPSETTRQTTLGFVSQYGAQAGINGDFYAVNGSEAGLSGMNASNGDIYSPWHVGSKKPSLNISQDNVATVVQMNLLYNDGVTPTPEASIYNALGGNELIVKDGLNVSDGTSLAPRTFSGVTADNHLLLMVVDGRQPGYSSGISLQEAGDLMLERGAINALNHDGGGSSTMVVSDPSPTIINSPSDGTARSVGNNLALFANPGTSGLDYAVYADFASGDRGTFSYAPGYSGSTAGINDAASSNVAVNAPGVDGPDGADDGWFQRLTITDDTSNHGTSENPQGWFVRHLSGSSASRSQNTPRPSSGSVGFWARTSDAGASISLAIDDENNTTADRGLFKELIADGQWHLYEWDLEDNNQWAGWINGDGVIGPGTFTVDSIQIIGSDDVTVDLDQIMHNANGSLLSTGPTPDIPGDLNGDGFVGVDDLNIVLVNWNNGTPPTGQAPSIPEPASLALFSLGTLTFARRKRRN